MVVVFVKFKNFICLLTKLCLERVYLGGGGGVGSCKLRESNIKVILQNSLNIHVLESFYSYL